MQYFSESWVQNAGFSGLMLFKGSSEINGFRRSWVTLELWPLLLPLSTSFDKSIHHFFYTNMESFVTFSKSNRKTFWALKKWWLQPQGWRVKWNGLLLSWNWQLAGRGGEGQWSHLMTQHGEVRFPAASDIRSKSWGQGGVSGKEKNPGRHGGKAVRNAMERGK